MNNVELYRQESETAPKLFCAIDGDEAGRRIPLSDSRELVDALLCKATSSNLGENCKVVDAVLIRVEGHLPKQAIQCCRLEALDGTGDNIAVKLVVLAFGKAHASFWKELDAFGERSRNSPVDPGECCLRR